MTVKGNHPIAEIIARKLAGVEIVPNDVARHMVNRAATAAAEYAEKLDAERDRLLEEVAALQAEIDVDTSLISDYTTEQDRLRDALQDIADLQNHPQDVEIARAALKE